LMDRPLHVDLRSRELGRYQFYRDGRGKDEEEGALSGKTVSYSMDNTSSSYRGAQDQPNHSPRRSWGSYRRVSWSSRQHAEAAAATSGQHHLHEQRDRGLRGRQQSPQGEDPARIGGKRRGPTATEAAMVEAIHHTTGHSDSSSRDRTNTNESAEGSRPNSTPRSAAWGGGRREVGGGGAPTPERSRGSLGSAGGSPPPLASPAVVRERSPEKSRGSQQAGGAPPPPPPEGSQQGRRSWFQRGGKEASEAPRSRTPTAEEQTTMMGKRTSVASYWK